MRINAGQAMLPGQLAALYAGNAREKDSQLFLGSAQAHSFVQDQARNMGIDDPAAFFAAQQAQQAVSRQPDLPTQLAARAAGQFAPGSLPGQLAQRDAAWDQAQSVQARQQAQLATLQNRTALQAPLPTFDMASDSQSTLQAEGMTPQAQAFTRRLGGVTEGRQFIGSNRSRVDSDQLTNDPRFNALLRNSPEKAAHVFSALTGLDLGTHIKTQQARLVDQDKFELDTMQDWAKSGRSKFDQATGKWGMRQLVSDPNDPSGQRMMLGNDYAPPDAFQQGIISRRGNQVAPGMQEEVIRLNQYKAQLAAEQSGRDVTQGQIRAGEATGTPAVFQSPAFAALQKRNPTQARQMWDEWHRLKAAPTFDQPPQAPMLPAAMNRYSLSPAPAYNTLR